MFWPLDDGAPWWLLTHYPEVNDTFTWLDGGLVLAYIAVYALVLGGAAWLGLAAAARALGDFGAWRRLAYGLTPLAGMSVFVGLSFLTTGQLGAEGWRPHWPNDVRMALLTLAAIWSGRLLLGLVATTLSKPRRMLALGVSMAGIVPLLASWATMFYVW
jgi:hypothetical protein